jgi:hypothetical protein
MQLMNPSPKENLMRKFLPSLALAVVALATLAATATASTRASAACPSDPHLQITNASLNVVIGGVSQATFTVPAECTYVQVSLVSYSHTAPFFTWENAADEVVYDRQTLTVGPGSHTLSVHTPDCYYQLDLVGGDAIEKLGPADSSNFYSRQNRLITASNGGTQACASMTAWTAPPTPIAPPVKVAGKKVADVCSNLKGVQAKTPKGYKRHGSICNKPKAKPRPATLPYTP